MEDGHIWIWDWASGNKLIDIVHRGIITSVDFSPDSSSLLSASSDGAARVWDINKGNELVRFVQLDSIKIAAYSPDGQTIASASNNGIIIWSSHPVNSVTAQASNFKTSPWVNDIVKFSSDRKWGISSGCSAYDEGLNCIGSTYCIWNVENNMSNCYPTGNDNAISALAGCRRSQCMMVHFEHDQKIQNTRLRNDT